MPRMAMASAFVRLRIQVVNIFHAACALIVIGKTEKMKTEILDTS